MLTICSTPILVREWYMSNISSFSISSKFFWQRYGHNSQSYIGWLVFFLFLDKDILVLALSWKILIYLSPHTLVEFWNINVSLDIHKYNVIIWNLLSSYIMHVFLLLKLLPGCAKSSQAVMLKDLNHIKWFLTGCCCFTLLPVGHVWRNSCWYTFCNILLEQVKTEVRFLKIYCLTVLYFVLIH